MARHHPHHFTDIPISLAVHQQLLRASGCTAFAKEGWEIAAEAIDEWMRRHNPNAIAMPATKGYQWKSLFLPDGTLLRTVFGGENHHCVVEADRIQYNGRAVSPSGFVNAVGGIRRNAWRSTWILLPNTSQWQLADSLRVRVRPPRLHKPVRGVAPVPVAPSLPSLPSTPSTPAGMPANDAPVDIPAPAPGETAGGSAVPCPQSANHATARPAGSDGAGRSRQQHLGARMSPARCRRGPDRRAGNDAIPPALRDELLSLLSRMHAIDGQCQERRRRGGAQTS